MFSFKVNKKSTSMVGVDITSASVKLLELSRKAGICRVESFSILPLPQEKADVEAISAVVKLAKIKSGTSAEMAVIAVPVSAAITKRLIMSADLNVHEMAAQIELEADQHIPFPLEEVSLDFDVIGPSEENPEEVIVMLAAARTEEVERQTNILAQGGLIAKIVDVEAFAVEHSYKLLKQQLPKEGEGMTVAVVDIGENLTTLYVLKNDEIIYTREQAFGGRQLTEEIQNRYGVSQDEASHAKKEGGLPDNYVPEVLMPFIQVMTQQISRALNYFHSSGQSSQVDHIILAGGCASISGIVDEVEMESGVSVSIANPFGKMTLSSRISLDALKEAEPSLLTACGLAMRSLNDKN